MQPLPEFFFLHYEARRDTNKKKAAALPLLFSSGFLLEQCRICLKGEACVGA